MSPLLGPCPSCARHVRVSEARCPFCEAPLAGHTFELVPDATERLPRIALALFATTLAVGAVTPVPAGAQGVNPNQGIPSLGVSAYGGPPPRLDPGAMTAAYGAPSPGTFENVRRGTATFSDARLDGNARRASAHLTALRRYIAPVRAQYERALRADPTLRGRVSVEITLEPTGHVADVQFRRGATLPPEMTQGLQRAWARARFPESDRRRVLSFTVTFATPP